MLVVSVLQDTSNRAICVKCSSHPYLIGTMAVEFTGNTPAVKDNSSIYVTFKGTSGASAVRCCLREKQYYGAQCTKCEFEMIQVQRLCRCYVYTSQV